VAQKGQEPPEWIDRSSSVLARRRTMKRLFILWIALCAGLPTAAFSRGGGAFGASAAAPGTNSLGTALSSSGGSSASIKGAALGTGNPVVDREDAKVAKTVESICRGC
jgi:hypothetical protein